METGKQIEFTDNGNTVRKGNGCSPPQTERQTWVEIDLGALKDNYAKLCSLLPATRPESSVSGAFLHPRIMPVIKANAYGHGAVQAASALSDAGARIFAVGIVEEGVALRQAGITQDILVMGTAWRGQERLALEYRLVLSVDSAANLDALDASAAGLPAPVPVHIKVDTGMGRLGCRWDSLEELLGALKRSRHISLDGVFSHLSSADDEDPAYTQLQEGRFEHSLSQVERAGFRPKEVHFPNSAGMLYHESFRKWSCRTGIALYGYAPGGGKSPLKLKPVLSFKTRIGPIREARRGDSIGYNRRFTAPGTTRYAILPVGYADGFPRGLSGNCRAVVRDRWVEVIGTVSMDMITVDLTGRSDVREGDEVTLLGSAGACSVTAETWAQSLGTIPYEILCGIAARVPRVYLNHPVDEKLPHPASHARPWTRA